MKPTNNHAERHLRRFVIWRKISFGTQSARGSRYVERIMTVVGSCKLQGRNVFASSPRQFRSIGGTSTRLRWFQRNSLQGS